MNCARTSILQVVSPRRVAATAGSCMARFIHDKWMQEPATAGDLPAVQLSGLITPIYGKVRFCSA